MPPSEARSQSIQVIDRAAELLEVLGRYTQGANLKVLAIEAGLHPSTAYRILTSLHAHDFVVRDEQGAYSLGPAFIKFASRVRSDLDLRSIARPEMDRLLGQVGETVNLTLREGDKVIYVERALPDRMMRVEQLIGSRAPLHVTAVGKILLGDAGEEETRSYARRTGLPSYTVHTINDADTLVRVTKLAQKEGFALDDQEAEIGVGCIGVLIRDSSGNAIAGLSISAPLERRKDDWAALLKGSAARISERLGFH
ncbi:transcriptional regulator, IclR family [Ectothiorhodosinus mongolicus]|uniref:Transcriptional regulator, IclR family n=1 Tax=Ectothiorhodosinus mongolicus TaxID=233100 RepID=A0A1R3VQ97_9GAMM|nr:IclR family transcriptional regulator [Ectothiorhodosinus mongolicus]ULX57856.1 IclR family transcriptional regulator [Ectothiorhodosinus mongolicus]SIT65733.1 transcriptional regulator, IclR family [Ectothiorhodosinus mongolicus]